jgi:hypothetical protein
MYVQVFCIVHVNSWHCRAAAPSLLEFCLAFAKPVQERHGQLIFCVYNHESTLYTGEKKAGHPARSWGGGGGGVNSILCHRSSVRVGTSTYSMYGGIDRLSQKETYTVRYEGGDGFIEHPYRTTYE